MRILHRTKMWKRAQARGIWPLLRLYWREQRRLHRKGMAQRSRGLTRSIPSERRQALLVASRALKQEQAEHRALCKAGLR